VIVVRGLLAALTSLDRFFDFARREEHQIKVLVTIASAALLAVFFSGPVQAQVEDVIDDYCREVARDADEAVDELEEGQRDLEDCVVEFEDCLNGIFSDDPVDCIQEYSSCISFGQRDQVQVCAEFLREFKFATRDALRTARRKDVEAEFFVWFYSSASDECLDPAKGVALVCAGITEESSGAELSAVSPGAAVSKDSPSAVRGRSR
jgi:hypothetical protein